MPDAGEYFVTLTAQQAVLGVDTDCGTCALGGLERLSEAVPGVDWGRLLHDTLHSKDVDPTFHRPYWCEHCEEPT